MLPTYLKPKLQLRSLEASKPTRVVWKCCWWRTHVTQCGANEPVGGHPGESNSCIALVQEKVMIPGNSMWGISFWTMWEWFQLQWVHCRNWEIEKFVSIIEPYVSSQNCSRRPQTWSQVIHQDSKKKKIFLVLTVNQHKSFTKW